MRSDDHMQRPARTALGRVAACVVLALALLVACKGGKEKPAEVRPLAGLEAVPASATVVVGVDVAAVASSALVSRAAEQLLLRDGELAERWQRVQDECKLDFVATVRTLIIALGAKVDGVAPVLLVASGKLSETELAACMRSLVGKGGGTLTAKNVQGRTLYLAREGDRSVWFGFGGPRTVALGSSEAIVTEALGTGKKVGESAELREALALVDRKAPIWAAGLVEPAIGDQLLRAAGGQLEAGPRGYVFAADLGKGLQVSLTALMAQAKDAKNLESLAKQQLALLAVAAQAKGLGRLIGKITARSEATRVELALSLDPAEINQLLKAVDSAAPAPQDAPPAVTSQPSP